MEPLELPYGTWPSPLSASDVAGASARIDGARFVDDEIWWSESLPAEAGRTAVLARALDASDVDDVPRVVLPGPWSARSRVHEYGGGAWDVDGRDVVFVEASDQRIYRLPQDGEPFALTPDDPTSRYGDLRVAHGAVWAVRERPHAEGERRTVVRVPLDGSAALDPEQILRVAGGHDFVGSPTPSPDGELIAWVSWDDPDMPWDASMLHVSSLTGEPRDVVVAGGPGVSVLQPEWTADRALVFSSDDSGRWNLRRLDVSGFPAVAEPRPVAPADADTGGPLWNLGTRWFAPLDDGRILAVRTHGRDTLVVIDPARGDERTLDVPVSGFVLLRDARDTRVVLTGSGERVPGGLWLLDVDHPDGLAPVRGGVSALDEAWLPVAAEIVADGVDGPVHAFAYPPTNPGVRAAASERPPYIVLAHGGPTSHVTGDASPVVAYFTSRGIGVLDVNYGGSSGYGRAYRERLRGQWGVVDVRDVATAARQLAESGLADPARLVVKGSSAGGWTVLCSLADTNVFAAGISRYGVADLEALAADTHDFEARYLDGLVGPLPEARDTYERRSPLSRPETLTRPVLILQGSDDPVVPPSQAEALRAALRANGVTHGYVLYEGESHGFRRRDTIVDALESELSFLGQILGFATPGVPRLPLE